MTMLWWFNISAALLLLSTNLLIVFIVGVVDRADGGLEHTV
jgi:hypothetical protein